jgi:DNA-directed RNA polymerase beta' subunit
MIIQELAVAPPPVRPSVDDGGGARSNDDLTVAYKEVIKNSNELRKLIDRRETEQSIMDCLNILQVNVATLMDNN